MTTTVKTAIAAANPIPFGIYHTASSVPSGQNTIEGHERDMAAATLVDTEPLFEDAMELAFMHAEEHAKRIGVTASRSGNGARLTGGCLITNNGSWVWYSAKPLRESDR